MLFASLLTSAALGAAAATSSQCQNPPKRVEWRELGASGQQQYLKAVTCLQSTASELGLENATRADDFTYVHSHLDKQIHFVASFLPWHRLFVHVYEKALRKCGYENVMPYWDWTIDSFDVPSSKIWDPETGFGGNGSPNKTSKVSETYNMPCVIDGPFEHWQPKFYGTDEKQHCLSRSWNDGSENVGDMFSTQYTPKAVKKIQAIKHYDDYRQKLERGPHGAIHSAIGGDMIPNSSPNDPVFFLHHTQIDRLWWLWQQQNITARATDFSGIKTQDQNNGVKPPQASIDDILPMMKIFDDLEIKEVMTTDTSILCYKY
ncbi:hypothetical protein NW752_000116 [Fusarium irregulare]|nr:hypothetical protein NW752_000116 [Fusarium irregulare]